MQFNVGEIMQPRCMSHGDGIPTTVVCVYVFLTKIHSKQNQIDYYFAMG